MSVLHIYVNINRKQRDKWRKVGATERTISTFTGASLGWVAHIQWTTNRQSIKQESIWWTYGYKLKMHRSIMELIL